MHEITKYCIYKIGSFNLHSRASKRLKNLLLISSAIIIIRSCYKTTFRKKCKKTIFVEIFVVIDDTLINKASENYMLRDFYFPLFFSTQYMYERLWKCWLLCWIERRKRASEPTIRNRLERLPEVLAQVRQHVPLLIRSI